MIVTLAGSILSQSTGASLPSESGTAFTDDHALEAINGFFTVWRDIARLSQIGSILVSEVDCVAGARIPTVDDTRILIGSVLALEPSARFDGNRGWGRLYAHLRSVDAGLDIHLNEALRELGDVDRRVEENALPHPSAHAHRNARMLIPRLCRLYPHRLSVYPLFDGEIAIEATVASKHSVLFSCEPDGSVLCLVNVRQDRRRAKYYSVKKLPDRFIRDALTELSEIAFGGNDRS